MVLIVANKTLLCYVDMSCPIMQYVQTIKNSIMDRLAFFSMSKEKNYILNNLFQCNLSR